MRAGRGGRIAQQAAIVALLQVEVMFRAVVEIGQVLAVQVVDLERHAHVFSADR